ncbi:MAG: hypothetical protein KC414_12760 [Romboutsia sp.]|nr:hypothetical protein [Romboutsia sp.]
MYLSAEEIIILLFSDKWLPSGNYFKIIVLSAFAYPVSALMVNVLLSKGNSKGFLKLEILKKTLFAINFSIGFFWGIEGYLYGVLAASFFAVFLNMFFVSKEINISTRELFLPIFKQILISISLVYITINIMKYFTFSKWITLFCNSIVYTCLFILVNMIFNMQTITYVINIFKKPSY